VLQIRLGQRKNVQVLKSWGRTMGLELAHLFVFHLVSISNITTSHSDCEAWQGRFSDAFGQGLARAVGAPSFYGGAIKSAFLLTLHLLL
jgi:hypothetical protein